MRGVLTRLAAESRCPRGATPRLRKAWTGTALLRRVREVSRHESEGLAPVIKDLISLQVLRDGPRPAVTLAE